MKSGKEVSRNKATVERYARKAKMYYGNNPKIQKLLNEIETETMITEKIARKEASKRAIVYLAKNPFTWAVICAIIAVVWGIFGETDRQSGVVMGSFLFGIAAGFFGLFALNRNLH